MGEGIIIAHPDTGFTYHPEMLDGDRVFGTFGNKKSIDKSFFEFVIKQGKKGFMESALDHEAPFKKKLPLAFPSHRTATCSLITSNIGAPSIGDFPIYELNYILRNQPFAFVTGGAPKSKLLPIRVSSSVIVGVRTAIAHTRVIHYAVDVNKRRLVPDSILGSDKVGVISISLAFVKLAGLSPDKGRAERIMSGAIRKAIKHAKHSGIIVFVAAGQSHRVDFPKDAAKLLSGYLAKLPNTIAVAGCDFEGGKYVLGHYGPYVDITAPAKGGSKRHNSNNSILPSQTSHELETI